MVNPVPRICELTERLKGYTQTFKGWGQWKQWRETGGRIMPFPLQKSVVGKRRRQVWLSCRRSKRISSVFGLACFAKCFINLRYFSARFYQYLFRTPVKPTGPLQRIQSWKSPHPVGAEVTMALHRTLYNDIRRNRHSSLLDGTKLLLFYSSSFIKDSQSIYSYLIDVVKLEFVFAKHFGQIVKTIRTNILTFARLKFMALARLVASGWHKTRGGFLFRKEFN
jgi:hypothetical protein